jgi:hypothetical protein
MNIETDGNKATINRQCTSCQGTGLYSGLGERDCFAVVCHTCKGTGCETLTVDITPFTGRKAAHPNITRVVKHNPGIALGTNAERGLNKDTFGGMPYSDWFAGKPFPPGHENRDYTCPTWWYQWDSAHNQPDWSECCHIGGRFADCQDFERKTICWARFDREIKETP